MSIWLLPKGGLVDGKLGGDRLAANEIVARPPICLSRHQVRAYLLCKRLVNYAPSDTALHTGDCKKPTVIIAVFYGLYEALPKRN